MQPPSNRPCKINQVSNTDDLIKDKNLRTEAKVVNVEVAVPPVRIMVNLPQSDLVRVQVRDQDQVRVQDQVQVLVVLNTVQAVHRGMDRIVHVVRIQILKKKINKHDNEQTRKNIHGLARFDLH